MKNLLFLPLLFIATLQWAQQPAVVIGSELGVDFHKFGNPITRNLQYTAGLSAFYPLGKFSVGTGLLYKNYGGVEAWLYTGESVQEIKDEQLNTYYLYDRYGFDLRYLSVPLRLRYRLPCNCVYLQAGVHADIGQFGERQPLQESRQIKMISDDLGFEQEEELLPVSWTYELAIGFKMHFSSRARIFFQPTLRVMAPRAKSGSVQLADWHRQLHAAVGVQYALGMVNK